MAQKYYLNREVRVRLGIASAIFLPLGAAYFFFLYNTIGGFLTAGTALYTAGAIVATMVSFLVIGSTVALRIREASRQPQRQGFLFRVFLYASLLFAVLFCSCSFYLAPYSLWS